jgi:hypothetical protein
MPRANLTLQLDVEVIRRVRVVAAERGTSVSALAAQELIRLAQEEDRYRQARLRAEALLARAEPRGGRRWTRDELYDRAALRDT